MEQTIPRFPVVFLPAKPDTCWHVLTIIVIVCFSLEISVSSVAVFLISSTNTFTNSTIGGTVDYLIDY